MLAEDKVVLVTGAASGIGKDTAVCFASEGARAVVIVDRDGQGLGDTGREISLAGAEALPVTADIGDESQVRSLFDAIRVRYGSLDCAHNNAAISAPRIPVVETSLAQWQTMLQVNLTGTFLCLRGELELMRAGGAIVNTASVESFVGLEGRAAYSASKHGVLGLTKCAAAEAAPRGIRVNAICPGSVDTPLVRRLRGNNEELLAQRAAAVPLGFVATSLDIARAVVWMASEQARFMTGESLVMDGGAYVMRSR
jgi:NAD(P)-dependent dehydrogenase (short-subunit alcohol dehydrogenase family)